MIGKSQIKRIASLQQKKYRREFRQFVAEGTKVIEELLHSRFALCELYATSGGMFAECEARLVSEADLSRMSALTTPAGCLAVFSIEEEEAYDPQGITVVLDEVRDPGNLGTIIRLCDWFGVRHLVASQTTVDVFNPKVVQATMGSLARVSVHYRDLPEFLSAADVPVYGTFMDGAPVYGERLPADAIIVFGNESHGISPLVMPYITKRITIPRFGALQQTESLNVATAAAITLSEFRRGLSER